MWHVMGGGKARVGLYLWNLKERNNYSFIPWIKGEYNKEFELKEICLEVTDLIDLPQDKNNSPGCSEHETNNCVS